MLRAYGRQVVRMSTSAAPAGWREEGRRVLQECNGVELLKYRHVKYGTGVVLAELPGPICGAAMDFATEAKDNKGLPHCLEHLCFFESKRYPRGVLDLLATRCGSQGTNASTDHDHTDYEFEVAGQAGLLRILPVFLHHILAPSLAQSHFTTEVFHVNGKGQNQGVVYSEMVGRCNGEQDLLWNKVLSTTFGKGSPYSFECGGKPEDIAKLTRKEIAKYHEEVYTTDNLHMLITGRIDVDKVLDCIASALDQAVADGASVKCVDRPFTKKLAVPDQASTRECVVFPSDDMSVGSYMFAVRLPYSMHNAEAMVATDILLRYLTDLASSPLNQAFVELADPIASSVIADRQWTVEQYFNLELAGVPYQKRGAAFQPLAPYLKDHNLKGAAAAAALAEEDEELEEDEEGEEGEEEPEDEPMPEAGAASNPFSLPQEKGTDWFLEDDALLARVVAVLEIAEREIRKGDAEHGEWRALRDAIVKERITRKEDFEDSPHSCLTSVLPELYFENYPHADPAPPFGATVDDTEAFAALAEKPASWWADNLKTQILAPLKATLETGKGAVEVRSIPDAKLAQHNEKQQDRLTAANKKTYGRDGLAKFKTKLEAAEEKNKIHLSDAAKAAFPEETKIGDVADMPRELTLHPTAAGRVEMMDLMVQTYFVDVRVYFNFSQVPIQLRRYMILFDYLLLSSNVLGEDYRDVVAALDRDMVNSNAAVSRFGRFMSPGTQPDLMCLYFVAVPEKAHLLAEWLKKIVTGVEFTPERVRTHCKNMLSEMSENMRDGGSVLEHCMAQACFEPDSQYSLLSPFSQKNFLKRALSDLPGTVAKLQELLALLQSTAVPVSVLVAGRDLAARQAVRADIEQVLAQRESARPAVFSAYPWGTGAADKRVKQGRGFAVGVGGCDAAYISIDAPVALTPKDGKRYWALRLLCAAVSIGEGDLTLAVRGKGLAYGAGLYFHTYQSTVSLEVWECTNVRETLDSAFEVLHNIPDEDASSVLSDFNIRNSIGSMVHGVKAKRETPSDIIDSSATACMKGIFTQQAEEADEALLHTLTRADLLEAYETHVKPALLAQHQGLVAGVVCDPQHVPQNAKHLSDVLAIAVTPLKSLKPLYDMADGTIASLC